MVDTSWRRPPRAAGAGSTLQQLASARYALPAVVALGLLLRLLADAPASANAAAHENRVAVAADRLYRKA